jgi:hypothetical protein
MTPAVDRLEPESSSPFYRFLIIFIGSWIGAARFLSAGTRRPVGRPTAHGHLAARWPQVSLATRPGSTRNCCSCAPSRTSARCTYVCSTAWRGYRSSRPDGAPAELLRQIQGLPAGVRALLGTPELHGPRQATPSHYHRSQKPLTAEVTYLSRQLSGGASGRIRRRSRRQTSIDHDGRPPNCQLCTSMPACRSGVRMAHAAAGSRAQSTTAVPSQAAPSDSSGPYAIRSSRSGGTARSAACPYAEA